VERERKEERGRGGGMGEETKEGEDGEKKKVDGGKMMGRV
jgi:hypothetical protein